MVASANVQTLHPHQERRSYARTTAALMLSKVQLFEQQFRSRGISSVGIQEGRAIKSERREGVYFAMFTSAADENGALGNQQWLDRELHLHILQWRAVSPRILFVITTSPDQAVFIFLTAHAPIAAAAEDDRLAFWS